MKIFNNNIISILIVSVFLIIFINNLSSQITGWKKVDTRFDYDTTLTYSSYVTMKCADSLNCIVQGSFYGTGGYYFRRTTDGGNNWGNVCIEKGYYNNINDYKKVPKIYDIAYPDTNLFIAVGDSGLILRTTNIGATWQKFSLVD